MSNKWRMELMKHAQKACALGLWAPQCNSLGIRVSLHVIKAYSSSWVFSAWRKCSPYYKKYSQHCNNMFTGWQEVMLAWQKSYNKVIPAWQQNVLRMTRKWSLHKESVLRFTKKCSQLDNEGISARRKCSPYYNKVISAWQQNVLRMTRKWSLCMTTK